MWFLTSLWSATLSVTHSCLWSSLWSSDLSVFSPLQPNFCHCLAYNDETSRLENASDCTRRQGGRLRCSVNCSLQIQRAWDWEMCIYIHTWKHSVIQKNKKIRNKPVTSTKKWIASSQVNSSHFLRFIASGHWAQITGSSFLPWVWPIAMLCVCICGERTQAFLLSLCFWKCQG